MTAAIEQVSTSALVETNGTQCDARRRRWPGGVRRQMVGQAALKRGPVSGHGFVVRGRRGDRIRVLWGSGDGFCLFAKRLERGRFIWPRTEQGLPVLTPAQLSMLLEGIDWRHPARTYQPQLAG